MPRQLTMLWQRWTLRWRRRSGSWPHGARSGRAAARCPGPQRSRAKSTLRLLECVPDHVQCVPTVKRSSLFIQYGYKGGEGHCEGLAWGERRPRQQTQGPPPQTPREIAIDASACPRLCPRPICYSERVSSSSFGTCGLFPPSRLLRSVIFRSPTEPVQRLASPGGMQEAVLQLSWDLEVSWRGAGHVMEKAGPSAAEYHEVRSPKRMARQLGAWIGCKGFGFEPGVGPCLFGAPAALSCPPAPIARRASPTDLPAAAGALPPSCAFRLPPDFSPSPAPFRFSYMP